MNQKDEDNSKIKIPGLNTDTGLALYGDDPEIYITVLRSYAKNTLDVIDRMKGLTEETLPDFAILVHGLKGISANIGAEEISEKAYKLEMTAKAGDYSGALPLNENLIFKTEKLCEDINSWLNDYDKNETREMLPGPDRADLERLRDFSVSYNFNEIDDIITELEKYDYENDAELVVWLREKIDQLEFEEIKLRLDEFLA